MSSTEKTPQVPLEVFDWQWDEEDRDANFKQEVATYSRADPMSTIETMSRNLRIPVGAIVRYILVKWAASGSTALLEIGPRVVREMAEVVAHAESTRSDQERVAAYRKLSQIISWLNVPLTDPEWRPGKRRDQAPGRTPNHPR